MKGLYGRELPCSGRRVSGPHRTRRLWQLRYTGSVFQSAMYIGPGVATQSTSRRTAASPHADRHGNRRLRTRSRTSLPTTSSGEGKAHRVRYGSGAPRHRGAHRVRCESKVPVVDAPFRPSTDPTGKIRTPNPRLQTAIYVQCFPICHAQHDGRRIPQRQGIAKPKYVHTGDNHPYRTRRRRPAAISGNWDSRC